MDSRGSLGDQRLRVNEGCSIAVAPRSKIADFITQVEQALQTLDREAVTLSPRDLVSLHKLLARFQTAVQKVDPISQPETMFDPSDPDVLGRIAALAVVAQTRHDLGSLSPFYGSGVYAIYYNGPHRAYVQVVGTETPLYVGKADPTKQQALTPQDQGTKLFVRLKEHAKSINKAKNLDINDFQCRFLVIQSGWERAAETHLIQLFRPVWNIEINVCYGIGKHGDNPKTRKNDQSPWDTLHPGRPWATNKPQKSVDQILAEISRHYKENPPFRQQSDIIRYFIAGLRQ